MLSSILLRSECCCAYKSQMDQWFHYNTNISRYPVEPVWPTVNVSEDNVHWFLMTLTRTGVKNIHFNFFARRILLSKRALSRSTCCNKKMYLFKQFGNKFAQGIPRQFSIHSDIMPWSPFVTYRNIRSNLFLKTDRFETQFVQWIWTVKLCSSQTFARWIHISGLKMDNAAAYYESSGFYL